MASQFISDPRHEHGDGGTYLTCDYAHYLVDGKVTKRITCNADAVCNIEGQDLCKEHAAHVLATMDFNERSTWLADWNSDWALDLTEARELVESADSDDDVSREGDL